MARRKPSIFILSGVVLLVLVSMVKGNNDKNSDTENDRETKSTGSAVQIVPDSVTIEDAPDGESFIKDQKPFIPTKEWQTVEEGQAVPRGLHMRLNLETGQREARLLDDVDDAGAQAEHKDESYTDKMEWFKASVREAVQDFEDGKLTGTGENQKEKIDSKGTLDLKKSRYTREELKQALKNFKAQHDPHAPTLEDVSKKTKFRSMDEIQTDFKNLGMNIKTDSEILTELYKRYKSTELTDQDRIIILNDLEYYLHQIDNAVNFADMGGIQLLLKDLNSTNSEVKSEAAYALSAAFQSNPKVQISALELGAMHQLIRLVTMEINQKTRGRGLTALSSLVRHFPHAQMKFLEVGGLQALTPLLQSVNTESQKLAIKSLTLVNDLMLEKIQVLQEKLSGQTSEQYQEKIKQYERVNIRDAVVSQGWCKRVAKLLEIPEHDAREKVLSIMVTLVEDCSQVFSSHSIELNKLRSEYAALSAKEKAESGSSDEFFEELVTFIDKILDKIPKIKNVEL